MRVERHEGWWLVVGGPVPPGADAITVWSVVIVRTRHARDPHLLHHELVHVEQWHRLGVVGFLRCYVGAYVRARLRRLPHGAAYRRIPLEIEAEWEARRADRS